MAVFEGAPRTFVVCLLVALLATGLRIGRAGADPGPTQAAAGALTARINGDAIHIHQLTEQLDQARLRVNLTSAHLASLIQQDQNTTAKIQANRALLLNQALRAYMRGGLSADMTSAQSNDVSISREYLAVASGDLNSTGEQLRQLDDTLRQDQFTLRGAQQQNLQATAQLQILRVSALSSAASEQAQLDALQTQLAIQAQAQARAGQQARPGSAKATQGLPVNNGLVAVVQQAAGSPPAPQASGTTPVTAVTTVAGGASGSDSGGHAGGVWLQLRTCESGDNYAEDTGNGYYGAYQFSASTWSGLGYSGRPDQESPGVQDDAAMKLQAQSGWGQWPACAAALGLT